MTLEIIRNFKRLLEFQPQWSAFARTCKAVTPFQFPEWLVTWWRHFGNGELQVFVFRDQERIAGVIPCFLHNWEGARQLTLIGSGLSDYLEPPIDSRRANEVIRSLQAHLQSRSDWDKCNWQDLSCDTPLKHLASQVLDDIECREIPLLGTFDAYWKARSQNLRRNIHRDAKKLETLGNIQFCVSRDNSPCLINALLDLHTARWQTHGQPGMIEVNSCAAFITDAAREFARQGMLRIFLLQLQQKPVAVILSAAYRGILFNYLTGFNPEYEAAGLGRKLLFESIRYAFENGFTSWNFLRGDEPYKAWWGAISIPKCRVIVTRKA